MPTAGRGKFFEPVECPSSVQITIAALDEDSRQGVNFQPCLCRLFGDDCQRSMRIITTKRLRDYAKLHPTASPTLEHWTELMLRGHFANLIELRRHLPTADQVTVKSGRTVTIFNIKSHYRLLTAIHYNHQLVFVLRLLTHAEYDQDHWKKHL